MSGAWSRKGAWREVALTLTILALALKVMVPQGFMIAGAGAPFPIAICTGHGPMVFHAGDAKAPKAPARKIDAPCAGAGNVTAPVPPLICVAAEPYAWAALRLLERPALAGAPGRGLAAPPPPSHAPPTLVS